MKKKTAIIVSLVILFSVILFYVQDNVLVPPTPEQQIERLGYCDVVYFAFEDGYEVRHSYFLGSTPIIGIGVVWNQDDVPTMSLRSNDPRLATWFGDVIHAALTVEDPWRILEVDVLYMVEGELWLGGTIMISRKMPHSDWRLDDLESDLSLEKFNQMIDTKQIQVISSTIYPRRYERGFNCERKE